MKVALFPGILYLIMGIGMFIAYKKQKIRFLGVEDRLLYLAICAISGFFGVVFILYPYIWR